MALQKITKLIGHPYFSIFVFVVAAANRLLVQLYHFTFGTDRALQLLAAKNFMGGHGISINQVMPADVAKEVYIPLTGWPPGYSIIVGAISFVTQQPVTVGGIFFDLFCVLLLLIHCRKILLHLNCSVVVVNCYTIVFGFFLYDFLRSSTTDLNALAFFMCSFSLALHFIKDSTKANVYAAAIGIVSFLCGFTRYMFIPVAVVIPLYLIFMGKVSGNKRILDGGVWATAVSLVLNGALLLFQNQYTGSAVFINETTRGFYPGNLAQFYPVIITAFVDTGFYYSIAQSFSLLKYGQHAEVIRLISFLLVCWFYVLSLKYFFKKRWRAVTLTDHFLATGGIASAITMGLLAALSIAYAPFIVAGSKWTFVLEARYFALPLVFVQLVFFVLLFQNWRRLKKKSLRMLVMLLCLFLSLEVLHGLYFTGKILVGDKTVFHQNKTFIAQKKFIETRSFELRKQNPAHSIIFTSTDATLICLASLNGAKGLYGLNDGTQITSSQPFVLTIMLKENERKNFASLLASTNAKQVKQIGTLHFFEHRSN